MVELCFPHTRSIAGFTAISDFYICIIFIILHFSFLSYKLQYKFICYCALVKLFSHKYLLYLCGINGVFTISSKHMTK